MTKKILIHKNETADDVVEKIKEQEETDISIVVPKGSALRVGVHSFEYIRDEAEAEGKEVSVESVDEEIVALARAAGLDGAHPFFAKSSRGASFSDIVPATPRSSKKAFVKNAEEEDTPEKKNLSRSRSATKKATAPERSAHSSAAKKETAELESGTKTAATHLDDEKFAAMKSEASRKIDGEIGVFAPGTREIIDKNLPASALKDETRNPRRSRKNILIVLAVVCVVAALWGAGKIFGRATANVEVKTSVWEGSIPTVGSLSTKTIDGASRTIPVEFFNNTKSHTVFTPASGRKTVSQKATGRVTVVNEYSSAAQPLVATTRFQEPDGRIYRLTKGITVPGAKIQDGAIVASSIEAEVVADQPGDSYNTTTSEKLTIPGFKGSPKFDKFYGKMITASGGFVGEKAFPTDADIESAKKSVTDILTSALKSDILNTRSGDFKVLDGASRVAITKVQVSTDTNAEGQFGTIASGEYQAIGFRENDVKDLVLAVALQGANFPASTTRAWKDISVEYSDIKADLDARLFQMTVKAKGVLQAPFNADAFRAAVEGKTLEEAKSVLDADGNVTKGSVSVWPVWLLDIPKDPSRIRIEVK